jgi:ATP/ADP translocase
MLQTLRTLSPRVRAVAYMCAAMSLHYGGYEFVRNAGLALFTSDAGFPGAAAFPLANALVSPVSVGLLLVYGRHLEGGGPRVALCTTTAYCIAFVLITAAILLLNTAVPAVVTQAVIGAAFLFQNSYVYMLASQYWSFTDTVVTPDEGAKWFGLLTGISSVVCTITASLVPVIVPHTGLIGLYSLTAFTLVGSLVCGDRAYALAQQHGFDPALQQEPKHNKKQVQEETTVATAKSGNRMYDAIALFRRVPTLGALFIEGISFQSLNTILNVAMVRALKLEITDDMARSAFTGRFYALVSGVSAVLQFVVLPIGMKHLEPKHIWRIMPVIPFVVSLFQVIPGSSVSLRILASALFLTKIMDYSIRSVVYNMVYQPLDFESRFVGKEIIGVFGSRFGKSGMSLLLSGLTATGLLSSSLRPLSFFSLAASTAWVSTTWWLSNLLPRKAEAQRTVEERKRKMEQQQLQQKEE